MIVTPEGLERLSGRRRARPESPARRPRLGRGRRPDGGQERVHAVLVLEPGVDPDDVVRAANAPARGPPENPARARLARAELPRTEGTRKLKRAAIRDWMRTGAPPRAGRAGADPLTDARREVRGPRRSVADDDDRRAGVELARAGRADGGARGCVSDAHRRRRVLRRPRRRPAAHARRARVDGRRAAGRAGRFPVVEPIAAGARHPARQPADVDPAARRACSRGCASRGASICAIDRRPGDLRGEPSEPHGHAGHHGGAAAAAGATGSRRRWRRSSSRRISFPSSTARLARFTNSLNYYLAALFFNAFPLPQREGGRAADAALHRRGARGRLLGADLPGRPADRGRRDRSVSARHRHDRVAAGRAGGAGADRGARQSAPPHVAHGAARAGCASPSARRSS